MASINATVDIDPWEVIDELDEDEIAQYLRDSGYAVSKGPVYNEEPLDKQELQFLMGKLNTGNWEQRRIYDKLFNMRS